MVDPLPISINSGRISSKYTPAPIKHHPEILTPPRRRIRRLTDDGMIELRENIMHSFEMILRKEYGRRSMMLSSFILVRLEIIVKVNEGSDRSFSMPGPYHH